MRPKFVTGALGVALLIAGLLWIRGRPGPSTGTDLSMSRADEVSRTPAHTTARGEVAFGKASQASDLPWREAPTRPGIDASNIYKNAFVLFDRLSEEEKKMIRQPREEFDADKTAALFEKVRAILDLLREAAQADYCDWGQAPYTFETPLPQIGKAQDLGKLALWAAAYEFSRDPAAAIAVLGDRAQLGHHISDTLIGVLVQTGFERSAHELLLARAPALDASVTVRVLEFLRGSKVDADLVRAFESECAGVEAMGKRLASTPRETVAMLAGVSGAEANAGTETRNEALVQLVSDPVRLAAEIEFIRDFEKEMGAALTLPEAEYRAWWQEAQTRLTGDHLMAKMLLPSFDPVQARLQQTRVERILLSAGLAVLQGGPAQLAGYRDPATGQALTYVPTPTGFDLRSTYVVKGKPVNLSFPQRR